MFLHHKTGHTTLNNDERRACLTLRLVNVVKHSFTSTVFTISGSDTINDGVSASNSLYVTEQRHINTHVCFQIVHFFCRVLGDCRMALRVGFGSRALSLTRSVGGIISSLRGAYEGPTLLLPKQLFSESEGICYKGSALTSPLSALSASSLCTPSWSGGSSDPSGSCSSYCINRWLL